MMPINKLMNLPLNVTRCFESMIFFKSINIDLESEQHGHSAYLSGESETVTFCLERELSLLDVSCRVNSFIRV